MHEDEMTKPSVIQKVRSSRRLLGAGKFLLACICFILLTYYGFMLHINLTTISFLYLLLIVLATVACGFWQASILSILAVASIDYYFIEPFFTFEIVNSRDYIALASFEVTALVISRLSVREMRNASEAAIQRTGMEQLYELSRSTLLLDLRQAPGPQLVLLIQRIFGVQATALFDMNIGRLDRTGAWNTDEEELARKCFVQDLSITDEFTLTSQRVLRIGNQSVGALVVRGKLNPLITDALATLAAFAIERHQSFEMEERAKTAKDGERLRATVLDSLAHEFKTPLTAVQTSSSGLLELGGLTPPQTELLTLINDETIRMNVLCTRLLRTAKLEAKQVGLRTEDVNVRSLIDEVLASSSHPSTRNPVHVTVPDPALTVNVDRELLGMIVSQYLDNARKYSDPGTPIEIAARKSFTEAIISVHNFGPTISIDDRERIFERFYRSGNSPEGVEGTGIGLSVVRNAAEAHHGHVWVISEEAEGTTFFVSLPEGTSTRRRQ